MSNDTAPRTERLMLTTEIVSSYISNNAVPADALSATIESVYAVLARLGAPVAEPQAQQTPAVPVKASVKPDYLVCLEDGKKMKTLKRYLASRYNLTPAAYRAKWNLPADYPMVAPAYAAQRKELALKSGFGRKAGAVSRPTAEMPSIDPAARAEAAAPLSDAPLPLFENGAAAPVEVAPAHAKPVHGSKAMETATATAPKTESPRPRRKLSIVVPA